MGEPHIFYFAVDGRFVDAYRHVNYRAYPVFFEAARADFSQKRGIDAPEVMRKFNLRFFVRAETFEYKGQLFLGDQAAIRTETVLGNTSITFNQRILKFGEVVAELKHVVVIVDDMSRPAPVPPELRRKFSLGE